MTEFNLAGSRVWVAGHSGMAGSAITRRLARENCELITATRSELNLLRQADVDAWMADKKIDVIFLAAATVGGILANTVRPAEFLYENLVIETNIIHAAWNTGVKKLLFLASSCIYPRMAEQPMREEALLTGALEPTNEWYAIAKIAGIKLCQAYRRQYGCDFVSCPGGCGYSVRDAEAATIHCQSLAQGQITFSLFGENPSESGQRATLLAFF